MAVPRQPTQGGARRIERSTLILGWLVFGAVFGLAALVVSLLMLFEYVSAGPRTRIALDQLSGNLGACASLALFVGVLGVATRLGTDVRRRSSSHNR